LAVTVEKVLDETSWDEFITRFPSAGPFHSRAWIRCFKSDHLVPVYLRFVSNGIPVGGVAGLIVEPRMAILKPIDRRLFFFSGPALASMDRISIGECMQVLNRYAVDQQFTSLISLGRDYPYAYDWGNSRVHLQFMHELIIDLSSSQEQVVIRMRKSIREQARKAERSGLTFHPQQDASTLPQLLNLIANTQLRRMNKSGVSFSPYYIHYLDEKSLRRLSESSIARFFVARRGTEVLCSLLVFTFAKRAYALLIGCSNEGYQLRAPAFVWFNVIRLLKGAGIESLNLAGGNAFAKVSLGAEHRTCTGSVSPYLKGPVLNLLFQTSRWADKFIAPA